MEPAGTDASQPAVQPLRVRFTNNGQALFGLDGEKLNASMGRVIRSISVSSPLLLSEDPSIGVFRFIRALTLCRGRCGLSLATPESTIIRLLRNQCVQVPFVCRVHL